MTPRRCWFLQLSRSKLITIQYLKFQDKEALSVFRFFHGEDGRILLLPFLANQDKSQGAKKRECDRDTLMDEYAFV